MGRRLLGDDAGRGDAEEPVHRREDVGRRRVGLLGDGVLGLLLGLRVVQALALGACGGRASLRRGSPRDEPRARALRKPSED